MRQIAQKLDVMAAGLGLDKVRKAPGAVAEAPQAQAAPQDESAEQLKDRAMAVLVGTSRVDKESVLKDLQFRRGELRCSSGKPARDAVLSLIKKQVYIESAPTVADTMLTTIASLDDKETAAKFLSEIAEDPKMPRYLRSRARHLGESLKQGSFR